MKALCARSRARRQVLTDDRVHHDERRLLEDSLRPGWCRQLVDRIHADHQVPALGRLAPVPTARPPVAQLRNQLECHDADVGPPALEFVDDVPKPETEDCHDGRHRLSVQRAIDERGSLGLWRVETMHPHPGAGGSPELRVDASVCGRPVRRPPGSAFTAVTRSRPGTSACPAERALVTRRCDTLLSPTRGSAHSDTAGDRCRVARTGIRRDNDAETWG